MKVHVLVLLENQVYSVAGAFCDVLGVGSWALRAPKGARVYVAQSMSRSDWNTSQDAGILQTPVFSF